MGCLIDFYVSGGGYHTVTTQSAASMSGSKHPKKETNLV